MLDHARRLNEAQRERWNDPEIESRIAQYEMAYRMQTSVPGVVDLSDEPDDIYALYGEDARTPGTFAANCLLARRLAEQDVRFVQLYHMGWDQHGNLPSGITRQAQSTDRASAALVLDLKRRGLQEDTLVVWGGEFGRTSFSQGAENASAPFVRCTGWLHGAATHSLWYVRVMALPAPGNYRSAALPAA